MRLAIDANILVGELLKRRGRELIARPDFALAIAEEPFAETAEHLRRRVDDMVRQGRFVRQDGERLYSTAIQLAHDATTRIPISVYGKYEAIARARIHDADDWPTVAVALALEMAIWTEDRHFFGCGCPVWSTATLLTVIRSPIVPTWKYAVLVLSFQDNGMWNVGSEGEGVPLPIKAVSSPWQVLASMGADGWELAGVQRTPRGTVQGPSSAGIRSPDETLDLVFKRREV